MDMAVGLYFAQARRYDATVGRFISEDKIKGFADAPFTLNPYSYCWNKPRELADLNGLAPTAGVTAAMGEELNGQTYPSGTTAGATSAIGDALSGRNEYPSNTSCDNEGADISDFLEVIGNRGSLNSTANDAAEVMFDVAICQKQYTLSTLWKQIKNAEQYKAISQSLGNFRRATRAKIKVVDEELEALGKSIGDIGKVSGLEIGVTTGTSTIVSAVVTGFVAGTSIPGIGILAAQ